MVQKIKSLIDEKGLQQVDFEPLAGLPKGRFSKWLNGQGEPTARQAFEMARVLNVPVDFLLDDEQDKAPSNSDLMREVQRIVRILGADTSYRRLIQAETGLASEPKASQGEGIAIDGVPAPALSKSRRKA